MIGQLLGHYRIDSKLGEGGMGVVYRATDTRLERPVAIKLLRSDAMASAERRKRFIHEAKAASALNHPNIVTIYDIDTAPGPGGPVDYIAMEYVEGHTLDDLIGPKGLRLVDALRYAVQIADALARSHGAGIVHRDLKPANVMVDKHGLVKLLDFGLAKLTEPADSDPSAETRTLESSSKLHTGEGAILGTIAYMSPEQAEGRKLDARSDIFSFGSVLYEMLSGRPAFRGPTKIYTLSAILHQEPKPLAEIAETAPAEVERIVTRCLRKDPERRYQHMADVKVALQEVREELDSGKTAPAARPPEERPAARRRTLVVGIASGAVLAAVMAGVVWWTSLRREPTEGPVLTRLTSDAGLTTDPAISRDGKLAAYASDRGGDGNLDIWVQQVSGGQAMRLTRHPADDDGPSFSPDGASIAFRSERDGGGIYLISVLGGEEKLIARQGRRPRFSPDGSRIAYWVGNIGGDPSVPGTSKIYVTPANGGEPKQIQPAFPAARYPIWSPDGRQILFWGIRDPQGGEKAQDWWVTSLTEETTATQTGAFGAFGRRGLDRPPGAYHIIAEEWAALGNRVVFSAALADSTNLWQLPVSPQDGRVAGDPRRLTTGSALEMHPAAAPGGRFVFASLNNNIDIWMLPIDANRARVTGQMQRLTQSAATDVMPMLAVGGKTLVFISSRSGNPEVWVKDMASGKETAIHVLSSAGAWPSVSAGGSKVAYVVGSTNQIYLAPAVGGPPQKVYDGCLAPWSFSSDETRMLYWPLVNGPAQVGLLDVESGEKTEIVRRSGFAIYRARFSPDDRWIAFHARNRPDRSSLYVVPFRGASAIPEQDWIPVTDGESYDFSVAWSPDGNLLYFLSERHGFRCIWAQRLNPATKQPEGAPFPVADFHSATRSMMPATTSALGLSASADKLVFNFAEITGNIWMARVEAPE